MSYRWSALFIMLIKSGLHLIVTLLFIFSIAGLVLKFDRSLAIDQKRKKEQKEFIKNQNKNQN